MLLECKTLCINIESCFYNKKCNALNIYYWKEVPSGIINSDCVVNPGGFIDEERDLFNESVVLKFFEVLGVISN